MSLSLRVHCYAGYRGEETPRRLDIGSHQLTVVDVLDRWLGPDHRYFKVRTEDHATYILRQDAEAQTWDVVFYER